MRKTRIIRNTIMVGLITLLAGASVLTMAIKPIGQPSFPQSESGIQASSNLQGGGNNSNIISATPKDLANNQDNPQKQGDNSQSDNSNGGGFVPDNKNQNDNAQKPDSNNNSNDGGSNDNKSNDNSNGNKPNDNFDNNRPNNNFNNNQNGHGGNNSFGNNPNGGFERGGMRDMGGRHRFIDLVKYGIVVIDSLIIGVFAMYLILSGFNKKGFTESLGGTKRTLAFIFGSLVITAAVSGVQIIAAEIITHFI
ncbi:MAG: hypothetical protein IJ903_04725 [Ruminococcus sp.]|nr:hypothetical protein [Ruminococcus sp.]